MVKATIGTTVVVGKYFEPIVEEITMIKHLIKLVAQSTLTALLFGLSTTQSFAAGSPEKVYVHLYNGGGYVAGLFYKKSGDRTYQRAGNWKTLGGSVATPEIPKGSDFCVSVALPLGNGMHYMNHYFHASGEAPDWYNYPVGNANLWFYGTIFGPKWEFNGTQSAGLTHESTKTQLSACSS